MLRGFGFGLSPLSCGTSSGATVSKDLTGIFSFSSGQQSFQVQATDSQNAVGLSPVYVWNVPTVTPTSNPNTSADKLFYIHGEDGSDGGNLQFRCAVDNKPYASCGIDVPPPYDFTFNPDPSNILTGNHFLDVYAIDSMNNRSSIPRWPWSVPPPGDACTTAINIASVPYSNTLDTTGATTDATDPAPGCGNNSKKKSVWYKYTATFDGTLTVSTAGTNYDTLVSVYTGSCGSLAHLLSPAPAFSTYTPPGKVCNDDSWTVLTSLLSPVTCPPGFSCPPTASRQPNAVPVVTGTTYYVMVSEYCGFGGGSCGGGTLKFNVSSP